MGNKTDLGDILIAWYEVNGRELPWRETKDPYLIWISEIILQQTRVLQGLEYYRRFIARFPDVCSLAEAHEDEVLKYWQGLGYYSRARNLHTAARDIMNRFGGRFPDRYAEVLSLKGIGEYTAAAICSFAWNQPYAVVDGNVYRVLSRVFGIDLPIDSTEGKRFFSGLAQELLPAARPAVYNQAIMDFGALQCVPQSPACLFCPLRDKCRALASGKTNVLPVKKGKVVVKPRYFNYFHIRYEGKILLSKRTEKDIWRNLYEFPLIETSEATGFTDLEKKEEFLSLFGQAGQIRMLGSLGPFRHVLSHRIIHACFYEIQVDRLAAGLESCLQVDEEELEKYAVSRLTELYFEKRENLKIAL